VAGDLRGERFVTVIHSYCGAQVFEVIDEVVGTCQPKFEVRPVGAVGDDRDQLARNCGEHVILLPSRKRITR
jgi:hypothetical protein